MSDDSATQKVVNFMDVFRTITGFTLNEAMEKMKQILPPRAYKEVGGGGSKVFTDINPAYMTEVVTRVFGPIGVGWFYNYAMDDVIFNAVEKVNANGKARTEYVANIRRMEVSYRFIDEHGAWQWSKHIISNGGSDNSDPDYAMRGAITNALGAAFAKLLWQLDVYKGVLDHSNAEKKWREFQAKRQTQVDPEEEKLGAPEVRETNDAPAPAAKPEAPKAEATKTEAPAKAAPPKPVNRNMTVEEAKAVVIPLSVEELPVKGQTLGEAIGHPIFGEKGQHPVLRYLNGLVATAGEKMFDFERPEYQEVYWAAKVLWKEYQDRVGTKTNGKKK